MIEITGSNGTARIMCDARDELAISHLYRVMSSGAVAGSTVRVMPDYHEGKGSVIGFTQRLNPKDLRVCPNFVGVDIGCRVSSFELPTSTAPNFEKLDNWIRTNIPLGAGNYLKDGLGKKLLGHISKDELGALADCEKMLSEDGKNGFSMKVSALGQLCSLGGGNHFIALNKAKDGSIWLSLHSGSRNLGLVVCNVYQHHAEETCKDKSEPEMRFLDSSSGFLDHYLECVRACQIFSEVNHRLLSLLLIEEICGKNVEPLDFISTLHNYIDLEEKTIRKGSISAKLGERVLIPFNMRDGIAVCVGKGNEEYNFSAPHGAGRLLSRAQAKQQLDLEEAKREMREAGVFTTSLDYALDEAAGAYKNKEMILEAVKPTVEVLETMPEIYNIKGK